MNIQGVTREHSYQLYREKESIAYLHIHNYASSKRVEQAYFTRKRFSASMKGYFKIYEIVGYILKYDVHKYIQQMKLKFYTCISIGRIHRKQLGNVMFILGGIGK